MATAEKAAKAEPSVRLLLHLKPETVRDLLPAGADPDENKAVLTDAAISAIRDGAELRKDEVVRWEGEIAAQPHVVHQTSFPPWGARRVRTPSLEPIEPSVEPIEVEQNLGQETRRTAVLGELRDVLHGRELPIELFAEAKVADLEQALEGCKHVAGIPSGREPTPAEMALQRSWARHSPDELVEVCVPLLRDAIDRGKAAAAARAKVERQSRGIDLVLPISPAFVDELINLWDPSADRTDMAVVALAALEAIRTWINRPPPPPPQQPTVSWYDAELAYNPGVMFRLTLGGKTRSRR